MSHQDLDRRKARFKYEYLPLALDGLLRTALFSSLTFRDDCTWTAQAQASAGLLWAWSDEATLGERLQAARRIAQCVFPRQQEPAAS